VVGSSRARPSASPVAGFRRIPVMPLLERHGWRAESLHLGQGASMVEVRDLRIKWHPRVATLRAPGEAERWLNEHGSGARGGAR
jgi:hypothetical protein